MEWWSNAKYQIPSTKSHDVGCQVLFRYQVSGKNQKSCNLSKIPSEAKLQRGARLAAPTCLAEVLT
jgi:hypothetical protein